MWPRAKQGKNHANERKYRTSCLSEQLTTKKLCLQWSDSTKAEVKQAHCAAYKIGSHSVNSLQIHLMGEATNSLQKHYTYIPLHEYEGWHDGDTIRKCSKKWRNKEIWRNQQTEIRDRKMQCQRLGNLECSHITSTRFPRGEQSSKKRTQQSTNIQICKFNTGALKVMLPDFRAVYAALYYSVWVERLMEQQIYDTTILYKIKQHIVSQYFISKLINEMSALL